MEEIISLVVANGVFAVLFCGLLIYQLRDGRAREQKYTQTIRTLGDRLKTVIEIKSDTEKILRTLDGAESKRSEKTDSTVKRATTEKLGGGAECATAKA